MGRFWRKSISPALVSGKGLASRGGTLPGDLPPALDLEVMDGVPALVDEVRLEVLMDDGTRLVVLLNPLGEADGTDSEQVADVSPPSDGERRTVSVTNTGTRAIRVSSHFPFDRVNPRLSFDRDAAAGFHLDIEVGSTVRWAPGETREVTLVRARA